MDKGCIFVVIDNDEGELDPSLTELAMQLGLPSVTSRELPTLFFRSGTSQWLLRKQNHCLGIELSDKRRSFFQVSFTDAKTHYRRVRANHKVETIAKACGINSKNRPYIVDATAGLGRDAFILASLGARVTLIERHPIVFSLLADAMARATSELPDIISRMQLMLGDSRELMGNLSERPEVIYLDPMFPLGAGSALPKQGMQLLQRLFEEDRVLWEQQYSELIATALKTASHRVVVKCPRRQHTIENRVPSYRIEGRSVRFEVYVLSS